VRPVVGIDPSLTATGVCWADGTTEVIKWPGREVERLVGVYGWVCDWFDSTLEAPLVVLEGLSYGSKGSAVTGQAELGAVMRLALAHCCVDFVVVPPSVVKKYATGKGNANKDLVRDAARDRLGLAAGVTSDECDAAWLRQIGLALLGDPDVVPVPKLHLSALEKLEAAA
jgi:Holliday junction resolvasome RuvABC endonuclease subunit